MVTVVESEEQFDAAIAGVSTNLIFLRGFSKTKCRAPWSSSTFSPPGAVHVK